MKLFKWNKNKTIMNRTKMAFLLQLSKVDTSFQWRWCDLQSESHELICRCTKTRIFWQWTNTHSHNQKFTLFHIFLRAHSNGKINKTKKNCAKQWLLRSTLSWNVKRLHRRIEREEANLRMRAKMSASTVESVRENEWFIGKNDFFLFQKIQIYHFGSIVKAMCMIM